METSHTGSRNGGPVWGDAGLSLPSLSGTHHADVCVVGLGGSGLACIGALLDMGQRVTGIDAAGVAAGAAGRNGGFLLGGSALFHHDAVERMGRDAARAIYERTLEEIERMTAETPTAVRRTGSLRIADSAEELDDCRRQLAAMQRDSLPAGWYEGPEGQGLLFPRDAAFDPVERCRILAERARSRGVQLFAHSRATSVTANRVETGAGAVNAAAVIVAVDGGLEALLPELASRVRTARLQMLATSAARDVRLARPVYSRWGLDYWQQLPSGAVVLGGGRDVGGDAEWTLDARPSDAVQGALTRLLRERVGTAAPVTHRWAATVGYTQSGMPILEQTPAGAWAVGAYSGTGNVVGALCGRAAAELATGGRSSLAALFRA